MRTAAQETILAILPVLDDFDRAKRLADEPGSTEVFSEGANIVYHKLYAVLKIKGWSLWIPNISLLILSFMRR